MVELGSRAREGFRRLRKFVLIVIWVVPLALFSVFVDLATGSGIGGGQLERGTAVVERCEVDGWPGLHLWHSCQVQVRWEDGSTSTRTVPPPDLGPADVGRTVEVGRYRLGGGGAQVRVDQSHPWAWIWWLTGAPALCLALGLIALGGVVLVKGRVLEPGLLPFSREHRKPRTRPRGRP